MCSEDSFDGGALSERGLQALSGDRPHSCRVMWMSGGLHFLWRRAGSAQQYTAESRELVLKSNCYSTSKGFLGAKAEQKGEAMGRVQGGEALGRVQVLARATERQASEVTEGRRA